MGGRAGIMSVCMKDKACKLGREDTNHSLLLSPSVSIRLISQKISMCFDQLMKSDTFSTLAMAFQFHCGNASKAAAT